MQHELVLITETVYIPLREEQQTLIPKEWQQIARSVNDPYAENAPPVKRKIQVSVATSWDTKIYSKLHAFLRTNPTVMAVETKEGIKFFRHDLTPLTPEEVKLYYQTAYLDSVPSSGRQMGCCDIFRLRINILST